MKITHDLEQQLLTSLEAHIIENQHDGNILGEFYKDDFILCYSGNLEVIKGSSVTNGYDVPEDYEVSIDLSVDVEIYWNGELVSETFLTYKS